VLLSQKKNVLFDKFESPGHKIRYKMQSGREAKSEGTPVKENKT